MAIGKTKDREKWVDYVKVVACVLVVLGHFFQSMVKANIIPENNLYSWFNKTIYYFHVPLFFICSGYLYQKYSKIENVVDWKNNIIKKLIALGIPYFIFSLATWMLKTIFAGSVNSKISGLSETLFINPTAPYWYLYSLFFIFLVTITYRSKISKLVLIILAIVMKMLYIILGSTGIYMISTVMANEIWFVIGMCITDIDLCKVKNKLIGLVIGIVFFILSLIVYNYNIQNEVISFFLGLLACISIVILMISKEHSNKMMDMFAKYTMPIFLMHTLFAAPIRVVLMKIGLTNSLIHIVVGLIVSFVGPICVAMVLEKTKYLEFVLYPNKVIKALKRS